MHANDGFLLKKTSEYRIDLAKLPKKQQASKANKVYQITSKFDETKLMKTDSSI